MTVLAPTSDRTVRRIALAKRAALLFYGLFVGMTSQAEDLHASLHVKLFACAERYLAYQDAGDLVDGRAVVALGGKLAMLSADRRELRPLEWPGSAGRAKAIVRLPGRGLLVATSDELWMLDDAGRWHRAGDCDRTGPIEDLYRNSKGQVLLTAEHGVFELTADEGMRRLTSLRMKGLLALPDGRWLAEAASAIAPAGVTGTLYGLNASGTVVPLLTGVKASRVGGVNHTGWELHMRSTDDWARVSQGWLAILSVSDAPIIVTADGRVDRIRASNGRPLEEYSAVIPLKDGRLFMLLDSGLHAIARDGSWRLVSTDVRLSCLAARDGPFRAYFERVVPVGDGRVLVHGHGQVFLITPDDRAILLRRGCDSAVAIHDGEVFVVADGLFRLARGDSLVPVRLPDASGKPTGVAVIGRSHVIATTQQGAFRLDSAGQVLPLGNSATLADATDRLYVCSRVSKELWQWAAASSRIEPVPAAVGRPCGWLHSLRDGSVLVRFEDHGPELRIDGTGTATALTLPSRMFKLSDGDLFLERGARAATFVHASGGTIQLEVPSSLMEGPWQNPLHLAGHLQFLDDQRGFGIAASDSWHDNEPVLVTTGDGGRTWRPLRIGDEFVRSMAFAFAADGRHGIAVGLEGGVWATADGGASWERRPDLGTDVLLDVRLTGEAREVFVLGMRPVNGPVLYELYRSDDGGRNWARLPGPRSSDADQSARDDESSGPVLSLFSDQGRRLWWTTRDDDVMSVMSSQDAGRTWSAHWRYPLPPLNGLDTLSTPRVATFGAAGQTCAASHGGLFCSVAGKAAMVRRSDVDMAFTDLAVAADGVHGWAVGADGLILATADGGTHWTPQSSGIDKALGGVFFLPDAIRGWAWGDGVLVSTRDGGQNWDRVVPRIDD